MLVGHRDVPALAAGAVHAFATQLTIPAGVGPANFLLAVADGDRAVGEPNELNNVGYADLKIGPDLHISAVSADATAVPGGTINVQDTTRNRGVSAAPPSVTWFYLGTSPIFSASGAMRPR